MLKILASILLVVLHSTTLIAQQHYFYGIVLNRETRAAISNVNITFTSDKTGCSTNLNGKFSFFIDTIPTYMIISHLGYETQRIWLDNTSSSMTILLKPASTILKEVEIKATNKPEPFFKDNEYAVLDYEVDHSLVYMLIYRFRMTKSELLCKSMNGDTVARSGPLPFKPTSLFLDCLGNLHVLSNDSSYQVYRENEDLILLFPVGIPRFKSTLKNCVTSTDNLLFFRSESPDHQSVEFYSINLKTSLMKQLAAVRNEEKINMLRHNPIDYHYLLTNRIPDGNENLVEWVWVKKILYKPNTSSLHKIDDILCVFNIADCTTELYTLEGEFTSKLKMPLGETNDGQWTTEIYIDDFDQKPYTFFLKGERLTIYRIDLNTGLLKRILSIAHGFPQKVTVFNQCIFYLYDIPGEGDNKHLFRQKF